MNSPKKLALFFLQWEGGLSRSKKDAASSSPCPTPFNGATGWHTNKGITYTTWVGIFGHQKDLRFLQMNDEDWTHIMKTRYWDKVRCDDMPAQFVADVLCSWAWGSGTFTAIKQMQRHLGFEKRYQDGEIGPMTIGAITQKVEANPNKFFIDLCNTRESFFRYISNPSNAKTPALKIQYTNNKANLQGWLNRLNKFRQTFHP